MGFSSGITTGVWMGRDDARTVKGLQGGTAPARAFAAFMRVAVAGRKIEEFDTKVTLPEWQLEPDEEAYFGNPDEGGFVDADGNPVGNKPTDVLTQDEVTIEPVEPAVEDDIVDILPQPK